MVTQFPPVAGIPLPYPLPDPGAVVGAGGLPPVGRKTHSPHPGQTSEAVNPLEESYAHQL